MGEEVGIVDLGVGLEIQRKAPLGSVDAESGEVVSQRREEPIGTLSVMDAGPSQARVPAVDSEEALEDGLAQARALQVGGLFQVDRLLPKRWRRRRRRLR